MKLRAKDGHVRSSPIITLISILGAVLALLQALPAPLNQSKYVLMAIAVIGAVLMFLNSPKKEEKDGST